MMLVPGVEVHIVDDTTAVNREVLSYDPSHMGNVRSGDPKLKGFSFESFKALFISLFTQEDS
jgi:hypothetical protein